MGENCKRGWVILKDWVVYKDPLIKGGGRIL